MTINLISSYFLTVILDYINCAAFMGLTYRPSYYFLRKETMFKKIMLVVIGLQLLSSSAFAISSYNSRICNKSGSRMYIGALLWDAQYNRQISRGWWVVSNNECVKLNNVIAVYAENDAGRYWPRYPFRDQKFCITSDGSEFHVGYQPTGPCIGYKQRLITGERPSPMKPNMTFR